jgi:hypothetical protein
MAFGLKLGGHRPARLTTASAGSGNDERKNGSMSSGPLVSPVSKEHSARFTLWGRKRASTATSGTTNGSFSASTDNINTVFQTFRANQEEEQFEFAQENGTIKNKTIPRNSDLSLKSSDEEGVRLAAVLTPRISELKAKSPTGAPIFIGRAAITEDSSNRSTSPVKPEAIVKHEPKHKHEVVHDPVPKHEPLHFKQSYQSRHKVPNVVKKILKDIEPTMFDWDTAPAYARAEQVRDDEGMGMEDIVDLPPPPPMPSN